jgi:hypothetical protein
LISKSVLGKDFFKESTLSGLNDENALVNKSSSFSISEEGEDDDDEDNDDGDDDCNDERELSIDHGCGLIGIDDLSK